MEWTRLIALLMQYLIVIFFSLVKRFCKCRKEDACIEAHYF